MPDIDIRRKNGHYEIYVDGTFKASADTWEEVRAEIAEIEGGQEDVGELKK